MSSEKLKRSTNFTAAEESILINLVKRRAKEIECKQSGGNKQAAWAKLCGEFNSLSSDNYRSEKVLRNKYDNVKKRTNHFLGNEIYRYGMGGGPAKKLKKGGMYSQIQEIMATKRTGLQSNWNDDCVSAESERIISIGKFESINKQYPATSTQVDEDVDFNNSGIYSDSNSDCTILPNTSLPLPSIGNTSNHTVTSETYTTPQDKVSSEDRQKQSGDWENHTPEMLRASISKPLKHATEQETTEMLRTNLNKWIATKRELVELQKQHILEEQTLKLKCIQEQHIKTLFYQEREAEEKSQQRWEQHEIKIEILEIEKNNLSNKNN